MAYRIVKETFKYGKIQYRVETDKGWFGLRKHLNKWKTVIVRDSYYGSYNAIYNSLEEAEKFIEQETDYITSTEIVATYQDVKDFI